MALWTVDLRLNAAVEENDWDCFQSHLGPHGSAPILGYEKLAARTVQLRRIEAFDEYGATSLALDVVRRAAEACSLKVDPTVSRVAASA